MNQWQNKGQFDFAYNENGVKAIEDTQMPPGIS